MSQPYISKLLNGNRRELSLRCRRNIYAWYLNIRRRDPAAGYNRDAETTTMRLEPNIESSIMLMPRRRERYVFRPSLIRILDAYFLDSPFPDARRRAQIAIACNEAFRLEKNGERRLFSLVKNSATLGAALLPKEIVTSHVVANWFANKRKEKRRRKLAEAADEAASSAKQQQMTPPIVSIVSRF